MSSSPLAGPYNFKFPNYYIGTYDSHNVYVNGSLNFTVTNNGSIKGLGGSAGVCIGNCAPTQIESVPSDVSTALLPDPQPYHWAYPDPYSPQPPGLPQPPDDNGPGPGPEPEPGPGPEPEPEPRPGPGPEPEPEPEPEPGPGPEPEPGPGPGPEPEPGPGPGPEPEPGPGPEPEPGPGPEPEPEPEGEEFVEELASAAVQGVLPTSFNFTFTPVQNPALPPGIYLSGTTTVNIDANKRVTYSNWKVQLNFAWPNGGFLQLPAPQ
jgi:hypothetical protein